MSLYSVDMSDPDEDNVRMVTDAYERCWQHSRGRYNKWNDGRLSPLARRFYVALYAVERYLMGGVPSLLEDPRFTLTETTDSLESFGLTAHAAAIRELRQSVDETALSSDRRERAGQLPHLPLPDIDRLNALFPHDEGDVYARLAAAVREHPDQFPPPPPDPPK